MMLCFVKGKHCTPGVYLTDQCLSMKYRAHKTFAMFVELQSHNIDGFRYSYMHVKAMA